MKERILIVDDEIEILNALQRNLRNEYNVTIANGTYEALGLLEDSQAFAVVISDFQMPDMNGLDLLKVVKSSFPDTIRVILTGHADLDLSLQAINEGLVYRFLTKPIEVETLKNVLNDCLNQFRLIAMEKELLDKTLKGSIKLMIDIISIVSPRTFNLANKIRQTSRDLARQLSISNTWEIEIAGLLSQLGFISIPDEILDKLFNNIELEKDELGLYRNHPLQASKLLVNIPRLQNIAEGIQHMFVNYDGSNSGEENLKEAKIPLISRILKVSYDFNLLLEVGYISKKAIQKMMESPYQYDPSILTSLLEVSNLKDRGFLIKSIPYKQLRIGMYLAESLSTDDGVVLISKGQEVTDASLIRLMSIARNKKIKEPIRIIDINRPIS